MLLKRSIPLYPLRFLTCAFGSSSMMWAGAITSNPLALYIIIYLIQGFNLSVLGIPKPEISPPPMIEVDKVSKNAEGFHKVTPSCHGCCLSQSCNR